MPKKRDADKCWGCGCWNKNELIDVGKVTAFVPFTKIEAYVNSFHENINDITAATNIPFLLTGINTFKKVSNLPYPSIRPSFSIGGILRKYPINIHVTKGIVIVKVTIISPNFVPVKPSFTYIAKKGIKVEIGGKATDKSIVNSKAVLNLNVNLEKVYAKGTITIIVIIVEIIETNKLFSSPLITWLACPDAGNKILSAVV